MTNSASLLLYRISSFMVSLLPFIETEILKYFSADPKVAQFWKKVFQIDSHVTEVPPCCWCS